MKNENIFDVKCQKIGTAKVLPWKLPIVSHPINQDTIFNWWGCYGNDLKLAVSETGSGSESGPRPGSGPEIESEPGPRSGSGSGAQMKLSIV